MQSLKIHKLGPIDECEIGIKDMMVFTGAQASGKSTVAKSIFFFKNIPNLLEQQLKKRQLNIYELDVSLKNKFIKAIRLNFLQIFGSTWCMDRSMELEYYYTEEIFIKISLKEDSNNPNYIWIELSNKLSCFLKRAEEQEWEYGAVDDSLRDKINEFFEDNAEVIYIPAGRSMLTLLSNQLNYIYGSMDDVQKREIDYCTQNYLERILRIKTFFNSDIETLIKTTMSLTNIRIDKELMQQAAKLIAQILQGEYRNINGEERLQISDEYYVKINFASSGQQEAVWILNVLFYYLLNNKKAYFIIEEPESHLFPNAQKLITEFIALAKAEQNQVLITTHSPYVLGTLNNLLYANTISNQVNMQKLNEIIHHKCWMDYNNFVAYYMSQGRLNQCMDEELFQIKNDVIDGASEEINTDYDRMLRLKYGEE